MRSATEHEKGFTLVEVVVALFICVITLSAILFANSRVGAANEAAFQRMVAMQDAHQTIERMRETAKFSFFPTNVTTAFPAGQPVGGFNNLRNETVTVAYAGTDPLDVTVTVAWTGENGRAMQYSLNSLMTQRE